jgi:hypothetical protein
MMPEQRSATLDAKGVSYLVVGGIAVQVHGHVRTTSDIIRSPLAALTEPEHRTSS